MSSKTRRRKGFGNKFRHTPPVPERVGARIDPTELSELTSTGSDSLDSPEKALARANLYDVLSGLITKPHCYQAGVDRVWMQSGNRDEGSFIHTCETLDIDPYYIRRKMREIELRQGVETLTYAVRSAS